MGSRANYIIFQENTIQIFFSNWGAETLIADLFWGPDYFEKFVYKNVSETQWLTETGAEGGAVLDKGSRTLVWYSSWADELQPLANQFLSYIWGNQGWRVERRQQFDELAAYVGVNKETVKSPLKFSPPLSLDEPENTSFHFFTIISISREHVWRHYVTTKDAAGLLMNGPQLLNHANSLKTLKQHLREGYSDVDLSNGLRVYLENTIAINLTNRELRARGIDFYRVHPEAVENAWPSWKVILGNDLNNDFIESHFTAIGEEVPAMLAKKPKLEEPPLDDRIRQLQELVFTADNSKTRTNKFFMDMLAKIESESGQPVQQIAPGADKVVLAETPGEILKHQLFNEAANFVRQDNQNAT